MSSGISLRYIRPIRIIRVNTSARINLLLKCLQTRYPVARNGPITRSFYLLSLDIEHTQYCHHLGVCDYRRGMDWILYLSNAFAHQSELQEIAALSLIYTIPNHTLSLLFTAGLPIQLYSLDSSIMSPIDSGTRNPVLCCNGQLFPFIFDCRFPTDSQLALHSCYIASGQAQTKTPLLNNSFIVACVFVAAATCLQSRCLAMNVYSGSAIPTVLLKQLQPHL
jgi:hypothetical protein